MGNIRPTAGEIKQMMVRIIQQTPIEVIVEEMGRTGLFAQAEKMVATPSQSDLAETMKMAKAILGKDFLGPKEMSKNYGFKVALKNVPVPNVTEEMLKRAKQLDLILAYLRDKDAKGNLLTLKRLYELTKERYKKNKLGKLLYSYPGDAWYKTDPVFTQDVSRQGWAFMSKKTLSGSKEINYLEQTQVLADYLRALGLDFSLDYDAAIAEFEQRRGEIKQLMDSDWRKAAEILANLQINQYRPRWVEVMSVSSAYLTNNNERLQESEYTWTNSRGADGSLLCVGGCDADGADVSRGGPGDSDGGLGASFFCSL